MRFKTSPTCGTQGRGAAGERREMRRRASMTSWCARAMSSTLFAALNCWQTSPPNR